ncbi:hypothetical protein RND81_07G206100 [Saponaria officinalis]|uniref:Uncharacterized protein n=1 Tax=Saponaria officinalis TaxID=3572 RepID=A0AAW1JUG4_SAPOF
MKDNLAHRITFGVTHNIPEDGNAKRRTEIEVSAQNEGALQLQPARPAPYFFSYVAISVRFCNYRLVFKRTIKTPLFSFHIIMVYFEGIRERLGNNSIFSLVILF